MHIKKTFIINYVTLDENMFILDKREKQLLKVGHLKLVMFIFVKSL